jgi:hypothetical protein
MEAVRISVFSLKRNQQMMDYLNIHLYKNQLKSIRILMTDLPKKGSLSIGAHGNNFSLLKLNRTGAPS